MSDKSAHTGAGIPPLAELMYLPDLEPEEARVLVAQDALSLLRSGVFDAIQGEYVYAEYKGEGWSERQDAHKLLQRMEGCSACILGILFLCGIRRFAGLTIQPSTLSKPPPYVVVSYLRSLFSDAQLDLIEVFYEGRVVRDESTEPVYAKWREAVATFRSDKLPDARMRQILQNVIDNKGTFEPNSLS